MSKNINATVATAVVEAIDPKGVGILDMQALVKSGKITKQQAFDIVDGRIKRRLSEKRSLVANVVIYRNSLAKELGLAEMPLPGYATATTRPAPGPQAMTTNPDELAKQIAAAGIDITSLMVALSKHVSAAA